VCPVSVTCCQAEVVASGWSLVQRRPGESGVSELDRKEASMKRRPCSTRHCCLMGGSELSTHSTQSSVVKLDIFRSFQHTEKQRIGDHKKGRKGKRQTCKSRCSVTVGSSQLLALYRG